MIKAIETKYANCRFRSRVEARWAIFFDRIGLKWEYEREGFELPSGRYLPDFWFPKLNTWAEVKGGSFSEAEIQKCRELTGATNDDCIMLDGPPEGRTYWGFSQFNDEGPDGVWRTITAFLDFDLCSYPNYDRFYVCTGPGYPETQESGYERWARPALEAAKSARFEFGENGSRRRGGKR